jgi:hypothetical protein
MAFTNHLWTLGLQDQATAYWQAYYEAVGLTP